MTKRKNGSESGSKNGSQKIDVARKIAMAEIEWDIFLDHAHNIITAIREKEGSWYVRTLISRWLEDMDDEESDTTK